MAADEQPENLVLKMLVEIRGQMGEMRGQMGEMRGEIKDLRGEIAELRTSLSLRIDILEAHVSRLGHSVAGLTESIDVVMRQLRVLLDTHDPEWVAKVEQRLSALERAMVSS